MCGKMGTRTGWRMGIMRLPGWSFYFPAGNQCWYIGIGRHEQAYLVDPAGFPASLSAGLSGLALHSEQHKLGMRLSHTR